MGTKARGRLILIVGVAVLALALGVGTVIAAQGNSGIPTEKAKILQHQRDIQATARADPNKPTKPTGTITLPTSAPQPTRVAGVSNVPQAPYPAAQFIARNSYYGPVGDVWLGIYAGATRNADFSTGTGILHIFSEPMNATNTPDHATHVGDYLAPSGTGPLTITSVDGDILHLKTDDGATLTFNLTTKQYGS